MIPKLLLIGEKTERNSWVGVGDQELCFVYVNLEMLLRRFSGNTEYIYSICKS